MKNKCYSFKIIFDERDRIINEDNIIFSDVEIDEYDGINTLREIVLDVQSPNNSYLTTT